MRNHLCSLMPHVSRFTLHVLLFVGLIGHPQGFTSSEMALIPAGPFQMGSDKGRPNETPMHQVSLERFYIDKYETTNADYRAFVLANPRWQKSAIKARDYLRHWGGNDFPVGMDQYPVTYVTHEAAKAYCEWRGKRLPTEAEWEKAARGTDGREYPWGNEWDPSKTNSSESRLKQTTLVGSYPEGISPYGCYDMGGNVYEWCIDWFHPETYRYAPAENPFGPAEGRRRVIRGGSWVPRGQFAARCANRAAYEPIEMVHNVGIRIAKSAS